MGLAYGPGARTGVRSGPAAGDGERGSFSLTLVIMTVALLALAGLVVDGGAKLNEAANASAVAQEAARAGAGMVDQGNAYSAGNFTVDSSQAVAAAEAYLASVVSDGKTGYTGSVTTPTPDSIQVSVTVTEPTKILPIIGIDSVSATETATASLVTGVTGPGT
ncbi:MAG: pilus assembly protein TadG-related protein [Streptosporangiaceae bacterium]|jgi:Flp pilus assembly protein TadG